ncbi:SPOR domain-containing protein [Ignavibacterium sp.]|jgi:cell division septation protein DedD|uniref:SPOR domain-containing protein n=1 Tax=Ignavibacterium sp. TaxID=2651167 RepID=UPI0025B7F078|nr:SPOR domain-containing protein [Ignavibacterium sp.]
MKKIISFGVLISSLFFLSSCSTPQQTSEKENIYIFDKQNDDQKIEVKKDGEYPAIDDTYYVVQIGAFTTKSRAENFAENCKSKINREIIITYSEDNNLYLVQITPFYRSRQEAELVRDELKVIPEFNDAWIVIVNK